jgi:hypothetical protein
MLHPIRHYCLPKLKGHRKWQRTEAIHSIDEGVGIGITMLPLEAPETHCISVSTIL